MSIVGQITYSTILPQDGNWLLCDGALVSISEYPDLYDALGHAFSRKVVQPNPEYKWYTPWRVKNIITRESTPRYFRLPDLRAMVNSELIDYRSSSYYLIRCKP